MYETATSAKACINKTPNASPIPANRGFIDAMNPAFQRRSIVFMVAQNRRFPFSGCTKSPV